MSAAPAPIRSFSFASRSRRRTVGWVILGLLLMVAPLLFPMSSSAHLGVTNSLHDNWEGQPNWSQDVFTAPAAVETHAESQAIYYNNQWVMFHRRRAYWGGDPERYTIALSTSHDGTNWTFERDVIRPGDGGVGCASVYAPKVLIQAQPAVMLTMVYEADPGVVPLAGCTRPVHNQVVALAYSYDGRTWLGHKNIIVAKRTWEGASKAGGRHTGNVGTPTINLGSDGKVYIGYHGSGGGSLQRGVARLNGADTRTITAVNSSFNNNLVRFADGKAGSLNPMTFFRQDGVTRENRAQFGTGFGGADIIYWQQGSGGSNEGGYYMVVEGFKGTALCNDATTSMVIAMARANSPAGPWSVQERLLLGEFQNPRGQSCGRDLPSWQYHNGQYKVILTEDDAAGLQRIALVNAYQSSTTTTAPPTTTTTAPPTTTTTTAPPPPPPPPANRWILYPGETLSPDQGLVSPNGRFNARMQGGDGNLVVVDTWSNQATWASLWCNQTALIAGSSAALQTDGNLVIYPPPGASATWAASFQQPDSRCTALPETGLSYVPNSQLRMQDDGNLVVYGPSGEPRWWSDERI